MIRSLEDIEKEKQEEQAEPKSPKFYLVLAALMVVVAIAAYVFQDKLFDLSYSDSTFVVAITVPIILALFFLYCYRFPRFGLSLLGHKAEFRQKKEGEGTVTYDIFQGESGSDEKLRHSRRKRDRHMRRLAAKYTDRPGAKETPRKKPESDNGDE